MPIVHISRPWGASSPSISDDLALLTPINPEAVASASRSLLDVSNLGKMSALSVSSPALAADLGGGFLWKRLAKGGKAKQANSKTRLLDRPSVQGSVDTLSTQISWSPTIHESVSNAVVSGFLWGRVNFLGPVINCLNLFVSGAGSDFTLFTCYIMNLPILKVKRLIFLFRFQISSNSFFREDFSETCSCVFVAILTFYCFHMFVFGDTNLYNPLFLSFSWNFSVKKLVSVGRKRWMRKGKYSNFRARPKILLSGGQGQQGRQCVHRELGGGKVGRGEVGEEEKEVTE